MPRTPVTSIIVALLAAAPITDDGLPAAYSHGELAVEVYGVEQPTAAQLSAVRRAAAVLVANGRAERGYTSASSGWHRRHTVYGAPFTARNPSGVGVRRPLTDAERAGSAARVVAIMQMLSRTTRAAEPA